jgi:SAM-dependent methyltransferase
MNMHTSSFENMQRLAEKYLSAERQLLILDVGSCDVNGSYKPIFNRPNWRYKGLDMSPGPNVDIVLSSPYKFPLKANSVDVIVSGQSFEHIEFFWLTWQELVRVLKSAGLVFLIAPSRGPEHRYPHDCWRFYPDGFRALAKYCALELMEVRTDWEPHPALDSAQWGDTVGVFRKPKYSHITRLTRRFDEQVLRRLEKLWRYLNE